MKYKVDALLLLVYKDLSARRDWTVIKTLSILITNHFEAKFGTAHFRQFVEPVGGPELGSRCCFAPGEGGLLPYIGYIGMCDSKGYGVLAILV